MFTSTLILHQVAHDPIVYLPPTTVYCSIDNPHIRYLHQHNYEYVFLHLFDLYKKRDMSMASHLSPNYWCSDSNIFRPVHA